ncbi:MAG: FadR/GntR family transcriptional regulator [Alphaproteobacteria bacterium]
MDTDDDPLGEGFEPVRPKRVSEAIYEQLRARLADGGLAPGARLASERTIALQMGVSRPMVREAINQLAAQGLLEIRPRRGAFVATAASPALGDPFAKLIGEGFDRVIELLEVRRELETRSAELAAEFATARDLADLAAIVAELERDHGRRLTGEEADTRFHVRIAQAAGNTVLTHLMATLHGAMRRTSLMVAQRLHASDRYRDTILAQHRAIHDAIRARDPAAARARMAEHLDFVVRELRYHRRKHGR